MTQEEFDNLKPGDEFELLDLKLQRTGKIYKVKRVYNRVGLNSKMIVYLAPGRTPGFLYNRKVSNCIRVAFPPKEQSSSPKGEDFS